MLREFGQFVGLLVIFNYVLMMTLFVATLGVAKTLSCCPCSSWSKCCSWVYCCPCCGASSRPVDRRAAAAAAEVVPDAGADRAPTAEATRLRRVRAVANATFFTQRHRCACACGPLAATFALFGVAVARMRGASEPPALFHERHNLGVAYELFGSVGARALAGARGGASTHVPNVASDGYVVPAIVYPSAQPVLQPTPGPLVAPTSFPTHQPVFAPTPQPTQPPSAEPTPQPSAEPSAEPAAAPGPNTPAPTPGPKTPAPTPLPTHEPPTLPPSRFRNSSAPTLQPTAPARKSTVDVTLLWDLREVRKRTGSKEDGSGGGGNGDGGSGDASALDEDAQRLLLATCEAAYRDPRLLVVSGIRSG